VGVGADLVRFADSDHLPVLQLPQRKGLCPADQGLLLAREAPIDVVPWDEVVAAFEPDLPPEGVALCEGGEVIGIPAAILVVRPATAVVPAVEGDSDLYVLGFTISGLGLLTPLEKQHVRLGI